MGWDMVAQCQDELDVFSNIGQSQHERFKFIYRRAKPMSIFICRLVKACPGESYIAPT
jgi:hypothetical protein